MTEKIIYVVLHYNAIDETEACIQNLLELPGMGGIVLVCNGSANGTDEILFQKYSTVDRITVLVNQENLGYAKGLNIGFRYAKEELHADFIVCMNNDVLIEQKNFNALLVEQYRLQKFALAAPDVINLDGVHCNPGYLDVPTEESVRRSLRTFRRRLKGCECLFGVPEIIACAMARIKRMKPLPERNTEGKLYRFHGCCWIFSKKYIDKYSGICSRTHLYGEEEILSYMCYVDGLRMAYLPELTLIHRESVATKRIQRNLIMRHAFYYRNLIRSTEVLLDLVLDAENQGMARFRTEG